MMDATLGSLLGTNVKFGLVTGSTPLVTDSTKPTTTGTGVSASGVSVTSGVFSATSTTLTFPTVPTNQIVIGVVAYMNGSNTPVAYMNSGVGLPLTTDGGDVIINIGQSNGTIFVL
ncbi:MAG: hypothetical protein KGI54_14415 [Pseudomonadota bacterium]|nr:hypothetical protein [Pseudomonadota bacterium]